MAVLLVLSVKLFYNVLALLCKRYFMFIYFLLSFLALYNVSCAQLCTNVNGGFKCECQTGYRLDGDGISCSPEVECGNNTCSQGCLKQNGVDTCTCNPGYKLNSDNTTCSDEDECALQTDNCATQNGACTNELGSFTCSCTNGFILGPDNECNGNSFV